MSEAGAGVLESSRRRRWELGNDHSQRGYRQLAPWYDFVYGPLCQDGRRIGIAELACRPGERVLDVCVGTGISLAMYPRDVRVVGVDLSTDMLRKAAARVHRHRLGNVDALLRMDAGQLAFADASFDKASLLFAVSGLPDPVRAVREVQRVCKPGATIVIANHFLSASPLVRLCDRVLDPFYRQMRYRDDLDLDAFVEAAGLDVIRRRRANVFGYATVVVCRGRGSVGAAAIGR